MNDEGNMLSQLQTVARRLKLVIEALTVTDAAQKVCKQLDYTARCLHAHSQKPLTSPRQLIFINHDLAAAGYWLTYLASREIIPAYQLAPLQQEITRLIANLTTSFQTTKLPSTASPPEPPMPSRLQSASPTVNAPALPQPPPPENWTPDDAAYIPAASRNQPKRRAPLTKIEYQKHTYTWTGTSWYDENYLKPPEIIIRQLKLRLEPTLAKEDNKITDIQELIDRARNARDTAQPSRSERLARRILNLDPHNHAGAAMLCAALRAQHKPRLALRETDGFTRSGNPALLTSRAAAFCDLGLWEEAHRSISQSLAIQTSEEAFMVVKRIKAERPDLYKSR